MNMTETHISILKSERQINRLRENIKQNYAKRNKNKTAHQAWINACNDFQQNYHTLIFDHDGYIGERGLFQLLAENDSYAMEFAICFIELRPYFYFSGYIYQKLLRKLKYVSLTNLQQERYQAVKTAYDNYRKQSRKQKRCQICDSS